MATGFEIQSKFNNKYNSASVIPFDFTFTNKVDSCLVGFNYISLNFTGGRHHTVTEMSISQATSITGNTVHCDVTPVMNNKSGDSSDSIISATCIALTGDGTSSDSLAVISSDSMGACVTNGQEAVYDYNLSMLSGFKMSFDSKDQHNIKDFGVQVAYCSSNGGDIGINARAWMENNDGQSASTLSVDGGIVSFSDKYLLLCQSYPNLRDVDTINFDFTPYLQEGWTLSECGAFIYGWSLATDNGNDYQMYNWTIGVEDFQKNGNKVTATAIVQLRTTRGLPASAASNVSILLLGVPKKS